MNKVSRLFQEEIQKAVEKAEQEARMEVNRQTAKALLDVLSIELISEVTGLTIEEVKEIEVESKTQKGSDEQ